LPSPFILPPWKHRFDMLNHPICSSRNLQWQWGFMLLANIESFIFKRLDDLNS
jgi:hypothetical protein